MIISAMPIKSIQLLFRVGIAGILRERKDNAKMGNNKKSTLFLFTDFLFFAIVEES